MNNTIFRIEVDVKPISWNVLVRKNRWVVAKHYAELADALSASLLLHRVKPVDPALFPVELTFDARWKFKKRHDIDSLVIKPLLDRMVAHGIFPDDSTEYVSQVHFRGVTGQGKDMFVITCRTQRTPPTELVA